jgi:hypothetical protein
MLSRLRRLTVAFGLLLALAAAPARAQAPATDGWDAARWRFGPLAVTPKVELKNLGWDSNVFNETDDPKSDFTVTAGAPIDWWLRLGRARLHGVDYFEGLYFATYGDQSSFNQRHELTFLVPLNRLRPYIGGSYLNTSDRPGYEINERVQHVDTGVNGGVVVRLGSRLEIDASARQTTYAYQDSAISDTPYSTTLNRTTETYGAQARYRLTSLTTLTLLADGVRERFTELTERDNDGFRILPGVEFGEHALITGKAQIGYRRFDTLDPAMPDFSGLVANAELSYAFRGMTRFTVGFSRDIHFSYEVARPFYVQPGFALSVTQRVTGPWDVQARAGWYRLDYQNAGTAGGSPVPERVDRYRTWGGGVGYSVGRDIRVGFNVDSVQRDSVVPGQGYDAVRGGMAVTYVVK